METPTPLFGSHNEKRDTSGQIPPRRAVSRADRTRVRGPDHALTFPPLKKFQEDPRSRLTAQPLRQRSPSSFFNTDCSAIFGSPSGVRSCCLSRAPPGLLPRHTGAGPSVGRLRSGRSELLKLVRQRVHDRATQLSQPDVEWLETAEERTQIQTPSRTSASSTTTRKTKKPGKRQECLAEPNTKHDGCRSGAAAAAERTWRLKPIAHTLRLEVAGQMPQPVPRGHPSADTMRSRPRHPTTNGPGLSMSCIAHGRRAKERLPNTTSGEVNANAARVSTQGTSLVVNEARQ